MLVKDDRSSNVVTMQRFKSPGASGKRLNCGDAIGMQESMIESN